MTRHSAGTILTNARTAYSYALQECPHWDYETNGAGGECCQRLADALETLRAAQRLARKESR